MAILAAPRGGPASPGMAKGDRSSTHLSLLTLTFQNSALILIMHYSRTMPPVGDHRFFTSTAVFVHEILKLAVSLTLAIYDSSKTLAPSTPATVLLEQIYNAVFSGDSWKLALPALGYTVQNLLQYVAVGHLDAVHFQVLYQLKILITAIFSVFLLRRPLGSKRWLALITLTIGVSIVSLPSASSLLSTTARTDPLFLHGVAEHFFPRSMHELGQAASDLTPGAHLSRRSATYEGIDNDMPPPEPVTNYSLGLVCVLVAACSSAVAAVYFEKILKESPSHANVWIRNVQLSFYSVIAVLIGGIFWQDGSGIREHGFFEGYTWVVWAAIVLQASGGLIGSLVIRDADNIVKNFATSFSIVISFLLSVWVFEFTVTLTFLLGTSLVLVATYLYSVAGRGASRPPPIQIVNFEKPAIERIFTPRVTPRQTDNQRLNSDPFDGMAVGMTSSRPSSPMLPRQASRGNMRKES